MKNTTTNRRAQILGGNLAALRSQLDAASLPDEHAGLLLLIADMFDEIASGKNVYMVLGSTQNGSAFTCNVKGDIGADPIYAASLTELSEAALDLL